MKKILAVLLAMTMMFSMAACGGNKGGNDAGAKLEVASAEELLNKVWETYAEEEKFMIMGGDPANAVDTGAGKFDLADTDSLTGMLHFPVDQVSMVDAAASITHAMNANNLTAAAFHVADAANLDTLVSALKDSIMNAQWMCGFPDQLAIYTVNGEYVVSVYAITDNMTVFKTKAAEVFGDAATLVVEENLQ